VDVVAAIERLIARDVGRGSELLSRYMAGSLRRAAGSLLEAPRLDVGIITGFFVPGADPPAAETDGPVGAVQLAAALIALGGSVRILTDESCVPVLEAAIDAAGLAVALDAAPAGDRYDDWAATYQPDFTHVVAIERVGPDWSGGPPRNMRGENVEAWTAPLHRAYTAGSWTRLAIGDGGNELGMGSLPHDAVAEIVANGALIHCGVTADALIVAGTSNWGAAGLVAALSVSHRDLDVGHLLDPAWTKDILEAIVRDAGAVDGVLRKAAPTVDGLSWESYVDVLIELDKLVR
jgi:D-glutamate cyclase